MGRDRPPALHHLAVVVRAPALVVGDRDGQLRPGGASGWYVEDQRCLDTCLLEVGGPGGGVLEPVRSTEAGPRGSFTAVVRGPGGTGDPTLLVERERVLSAEATGQGPVSRLQERIELTAAGAGTDEPVDVDVHLRLGTDLASLARVRADEHPAARAAPTTVGGAKVPGTVATWPGVGLRADPAPDDVRREGEDVVLTWRLRLVPGRASALTLTAVCESATTFAPAASVPWVADAGGRGVDTRVDRLLAQSLSDLGGLLLADPATPEQQQPDLFLAAGSPWFLTLFGRDSLWAARLLLPWSTALAMSTLRVLARRQGARDDPATEEQPGKILHEVRGQAFEVSGMRLPPVYYGTVDATALFVCLLADAHDWGADGEEVRALLPAARRCLAWVVEQSSAPGSGGWLRYVDHSGHGLANQGWKDSADGVQHADGRLAEPPIALCEVQAYAYEAAVRGGALLAAFGEQPPAGLAAWAQNLRRRFHDAFWVDGPAADGTAGGHVAIALDGQGARADSVTSNMGHLLGTGLLAPEREARVADVLGGGEMSSAAGLRTMATTSARYGPLSYHGGSVWPHDTAIAVTGLARSGRLEEAAALTRGLLEAAPGVGYRLPELFGGDASPDAPPSAYPASCRPQAWAAAAPLAALWACTGVRVDAATRTVTHPASVPTTLGAFRLDGVQVAGQPLHVAVGDGGRVEVGAPEGWTVRPAG